MSHDPCARCNELTGSLYDSLEITLGGDAPPLTFCSYDCLGKWARAKAKG